jgi:hypothetical protein
MKGDLFHTNQQIKAGGLDAYIQLRDYDAYFKNLDTVGAPLALLEPVAGDMSVLNNTAALGEKRRPLTVGMGFLIGLADDGMCLFILVFVVKTLWAFY